LGFCFLPCTAKFTLGGAAAGDAAAVEAVELVEEAVELVREAASPRRQRPRGRLLAQLLLSDLRVAQQLAPGRRAARLVPVPQVVLPGQKLALDPPAQPRKVPPQARVRAEQVRMSPAAVHRLAS
jgi:hypothetical protein